MTKAEKLAALNAKLEASERMGDGFKERIAAIRQDIARVEALPDDGDSA